MNMKYAVGITMIVFVVFMSAVFGYGFVLKQQKESATTTPANSSTDTTNTDIPSTSSSDTTSSSASSSSSTTVTTTEVAKHKTANNCWLIISGKAYNITNFLDQHPGGSDVILPFCGKDATQAFDTQGGRGRSHSGSAKAMLADYIVGTLQ